MQALVFRIRTNSLYSIRIPFTWQSALTYPILPPSAVIGIIANAIQRYKGDRHPRDYLAITENVITWAGSRLLGPCVIKSYTTSAIVKWEDIFPWKFTNALGREFAHTLRLEAIAIFREGELISEIMSALKTTPLTCGDSESPVTVEEVVLREVSEVHEEEVETSYPVPWVKDLKIISGCGKLYLMHERCLKQGSIFPLKPYIVPLEEKGRILKPSKIKIVRAGAQCFRVEDTDTVVLSGTFFTSEVSDHKSPLRRRRRK